MTTILEEIEEIINSLGDCKDRAIASRRILVLQHRPTLEILGCDLGFSREAVRQREVNVKHHIGDRRTALSKALTNEIFQFADRAGQGLDLDKALRSMPGCLLESGCGKSTMQRQMFLYLAGPYEIWHGLLLRAELKTKVENLCQKLWHSLRRRHTLTTEDADQFANRLGITSPDIVNKALERVQSEHPNVYAISGGEYIYQPKAADRAVRALQERGGPLVLDELAQTCRVSAESLLNAIGNDERIARLDRNSYGLTQWGSCEYDGIVGSIHKALAELGSNASLEGVADWVTERFEVEWGSVIGFATRHHDFVATNGKVRRRRDGEDPKCTDSRQLGEIGDCLEIDGHPALRVMIDDRLWRGSGRPVPRWWANRAGLSPGQKMHIGTGQNSALLSWVGTEPALGSLRSLASKNNWPQEGVGFPDSIRKRAKNRMETIAP